MFCKKVQKRCSGKGVNYHGAPLAIIVCGDHTNVFVRPYDKKDMVSVDATIVANHIVLEAEDLDLFDAPIDDNGEVFQNCIHLYKRDNGKYDVLMLLCTTVRLYSMEKNTFPLYKELNSTYATYDGFACKFYL